MAEEKVEAKKEMTVEEAKLEGRYEGLMIAGDELMRQALAAFHAKKDNQAATLRAIADRLNINPNKLYCEFIGLNHLSWIKSVFIDGINKINDLFAKDIFKEGLMSNIPKVKGNKELLKSLRLIPSPYLDYYYFVGLLL